MRRRRRRRRRGGHRDREAGEIKSSPCALRKRRSCSQPAMLNVGSVLEGRIKERERERERGEMEIEGEIAGEREVERRRREEVEQ